VNITHNECIKTLNDDVRHLELEEDRIETSKSQKTETTMHLAGSSSHGKQSQKLSQMMTKERASKRKNIRDSIMTREKLLKIVLRSITRPRSSVSIVARMIIILVNAISPVRYK
jgi:hypothetical protein